MADDGPVSERDGAASAAGLLGEIERDLVSDRPVADVLRKCVLLGGHVQSTELRDWATKELRGYNAADDLPDYRVVGAGLFVDATTINAVITGQQISTTSLPDGAKSVIKEQVDFRQGIGAIEALIGQADLGGKGMLKLLVPSCAEICAIMNYESGNQYQNINSVYWQVSAAALRGIVDQVRTSLTELVAELRAGTPVDRDMPARDVVSQAVNVAVRGIGSRVTVATTSTSGQSRAPVSVGANSETTGFWTWPKKIGALIVGLCTIAGLILATLQFHH